MVRTLSSNFAFPLVAYLGLLLLQGCDSAEPQTEVDDNLVCTIESPGANERVASPWMARVQVTGLTTASTGTLSFGLLEGTVLAEQPLASDGVIELGPFTLEPGEHDLVLVAAQGDARCEATQTVLVKGGPMVTILTPAPGQSFTLGAVIPLTAEVSDPDERTTDLGLRWVSSLDGDLGDAVLGATGISEPVNAALSQGQHELTAMAQDGDGNTAMASVHRLYHRSSGPARVGSHAGRAHH